METLQFQPADELYIAIAAGVLALDWLARRLLPATFYFFLKLPVTFMHEFQHWIAALLLGGDARITSLIPARQPDGLFLLGSTRYEGVGYGFIGPALVNLAPMLNLIPAIVCVSVLRTTPLPGMGGVIVLCFALFWIEAGIPSWSDIRQAGILAGTLAFAFFAWVMFYAGPLAIGGSMLHLLGLGA